METERLQDNPFYNLFVIHFRTLMHQYIALKTRLSQVAISDKDVSLVLCLPQSLSLREEVTLKQVSSHILMPFKDEFITLDGNLVSIRGNNILVLGIRKDILNFEEENSQVVAKRMVRIMVNEDLEMESKVKVLYIDRPLYGGCSSTCTIDGFDAVVINEYLWLLKSLPEFEILFKSLDSVISNARDQLKQLQPNDDDSRLKQGLKYWVRYSASKVVQCSPAYSSLYNGDLSSSVKRHVVQLEQVMEAYIFNALHPEIIQLVSRRLKDENERLSCILEHLLDLNFTQEDLGMKPEFQCCQTTAVDLLLTLSECLTPLEKLLCLDKVMVSINRTIESKMMAHFERISQFQITTDDLLDQLIYVFIQAHRRGFRDIVTHIHFMREYHTLNLNTNGLGFNLTNIQVAVEWILTSGNKPDFKEISHLIKTRH